MTLERVRYLPVFTSSLWQPIASEYIVSRSAFSPLAVVDRHKQAEPALKTLPVDVRINRPSTTGQPLRWRGSCRKSSKRTNYWPKRALADQAGCAAIQPSAAKSKRGIMPEPLAWVLEQILR